MNFDLSNVCDWYIPGNNGTQLSVLKVVDELGRVIWRKRYIVTVSAGTGGVNGSHFLYYPSTSQQTKSISLPTRTGYKIVSWTFTGYTGATPSVSGSTVMIPANTYGNFTMTPTWSKDYITITFDSNGGS